MAAIVYPDGHVEVPITAVGDHLAADGVQTLWPGDNGYDQAAAAALPADQHPLLAPRNHRRAAELEALFAAWDAKQATA
ncbi:hypothetical protein [Actinomadura kijaniata]|uniref:hypothetical protein n=1 Tax=Actinomadura kijaniata TaxID=46161 RepID=UPI0008311594|nr:hypothetical protein [Actinomadura kijaniata]